MNRTGCFPAATTLVAAALAMSLTGLASAAPAAEPHAHPPADATHAPGLDHGRKWATDAPLREGMARLRGLVAPRLAAAEAGQIDAAQYQALGTQVQGEVATIVAQCKLAPEADATLHAVIARLMAGADAMAGKSARHPPEHGLHLVALALDDYGRVFDDPGYQPINPGR